MHSNHQQQLHVIFLPFMAPGHMMPMIDIARLFTFQGNTKATIIATTSNASRFKKTINRDTTSGRQIAFLTISLPIKEACLPEGFDDLAFSPTPETGMRLLQAIEMLQPKLETMLVESHPDCIVSDYLYPWTIDVAKKLGIPRLAFSGSSFFNNCICYCLEKYRPHDKIQSESEEFMVPNLPDTVILTRSQLQDLVKGRTSFDEMFNRLKEAERKSFGVLMNSFYELEPAYVGYFRKEMGIKSWHIGPLSLFNKMLENKVEQEGSNNTQNYVINWLNSKQSQSVLYTCFGSSTQFTKPQLLEIENALHDSGYPFIWVIGRVIKSDEDQNQEQKEDPWWLSEKFNEDMKENGRGMIIRGWAPQVMILEHSATGCFMTHCGWNSILEAVCAGVPMVTWPGFADQFHNEKLVTQVLKIGVEVGNMEWKAWATQKSKLIKKDQIKMAITKVMREGREREEIQTRAKELSKLAHKAVEGGSSCNDIRVLLEEVRLYKKS